jgi:hypothetical protein
MESRDITKIDAASAVHCGKLLVHVQLSLHMQQLMSSRQALGKFFGENIEILI